MDPFQAAIAALELQSKPNISEIAKMFGLDRSTLSRRWNGRAGSKASQYEYQSLLCDAQELELIKYITELSEQAFPPTGSMVRVFAAEIAGKCPGKNWVGGFVRRHPQIQQGYLHGFDLKRKKADNYFRIDAFFKLVYQPVNQSKINN
jgi:transposase-like protein